MPEGDHAPWRPAADWVDAAGGIDLWCGALRLPEGDEGCLDPEERARAARFIHASRGASFTAARSTLRRILARYVSANPGEVRFEYGPHGKPTLHPEHGRISFNLSHSGDHLLLAVSREHPVGADLEVVRLDRRLLEIAARFFAPEEYRRVLDAAPEDRAALFYVYWSCKEAYLKFHGTGFSFPASDFCVALGESHHTVAWTRLASDPSPAWQIASVDLPVPGYRAAVCSPMCGAVRRFSWPTADAL